jgi:hypothetical protein
MRIVVKVWSSDSERGLGYDYAIIECSEALLKRCLHRIGILRSQRALDPSLDEMCYWDSSAEYFSLWVHPLSPEAENQSCELAKTIDALEVDNREAVIVAEQLNVSHECTGTVECAEMIVRNEGITFSALLRHDDVRLTTAEISQQLLESVLTANK